MNILVIDYESYFCSKTYTLRKLTTEEYLRDPRWKAHGIGYSWNGNGYYWVTGSKIPAFFATIDWSNTAVCCQHGQHEGLILSHHYGVYPKMFLDTLSMGNLVLQNHSKALDNMAAFFGLPGKTVPYNLFDGVRDLPPHIERQVADGCLHDCWLNWEIFLRMLRGDPERRIPPFPRGELEVIDATIKMFSEPVLEIDIPRARALSARIIARKERHLEAVYDWLVEVAPGLVPPPIQRKGKPPPTKIDAMRDALRSRDTFAAILEAFDIEPPMKMNKKGEAMTYAFAKNDAGMRELLESDNEWIATLVETKLESASTIDETRALRFARTAERGQPVPVYLHYNSTFSSRHSGGDKMNFSNLERLPNMVNGEYEKAEDGSIRKGEIRLCIKAPKRKKIVVADLAQIECRTLAFHSGQLDLLEDFRNKVDVYSKFISPYYGFEVSKAYPAQRGVGKQLRLSCGYKSGAKTIKHTAALGSYGPPVHLTLVEAEALKDFYRAKNEALSRRGGHWDIARDVIEMLYAGQDYTWGPVTIHDHRIWLPNDVFLDYSNLSRLPPDPDRLWAKNWLLKTRKGVTRLYDGKVTAHVNSALARVIMTEAMRLIAPRYKVALTCYDEVACLVDEDEAEECMAYMKWALGLEPWWAPGLPIEVEAHISTIYDK